MEKPVRSSYSYARRVLIAALLITSFVWGIVTFLTFGDGMYREIDAVVYGCTILVSSKAVSFTPAMLSWLWPAIMAAAAWVFLPRTHLVDRSGYEKMQSDAVYKLMLCLGIVGAVVGAVVYLADPGLHAAVADLDHLGRLLPQTLQLRSLVEVGGGVGTVFGLLYCATLFDSSPDTNAIRRSATVGFMIAFGLAVGFRGIQNVVIVLSALAVLLVMCVAFYVLRTIYRLVFPPREIKENSAA